MDRQRYDLILLVVLGVLFVSPLYVEGSADDSTYTFSATFEINSNCGGPPSYVSGMADSFGGGLCDNYCYNESNIPEYPGYAVQLDSSWCPSADAESPPEGPWAVFQSTGVTYFLWTAGTSIEGITMYVELAFRADGSCIHPSPGQNYRVSCTTITEYSDWDCTDESGTSSPFDYDMESYSYIYGNFTFYCVTPSSVQVVYPPAAASTHSPPTSEPSSSSTPSSGSGSGSGSGSSGNGYPDDNSGASLTPFLIFVAAAAIACIL